MSLFNKLALWHLMFIALSGARCAVSAGNPVGEDAFITPNPVTHVSIYNYLDGLNFTLHCKSKDDDLGIHVIAPGENYNWQFRANIILTTLFFCGVSWRDAQGVFDIYKAKRDLIRCETECIWHVKKDAIIGYNDWEEPDIVFRWPNSS